MTRNNQPHSHPLLLCFELLAACILACVVFLPSSRVYASTSDLRQLETKARQGYINQEIQLGEAYFTGNGAPRDPSQAAYWYQKAAESGNPEAQNLVGYFYEVGFGVPANATRAMHWFQLASASGLPDATLNIGVLYVMGLGVDKDATLAAEYFERAARKGNGTGATYLATLYYTGTGVAQDKTAAEHWYLAGEKMHDPIATYDLGALYSTVPGHPHNLSRAARFLRQSAATGYAPAMHSLALLLVHHPEFAKSPQEAHQDLAASADAGYWKSSILLAILERDGNGIPVDLASAYYHFRLAALQGGAQAQPFTANDIRILQHTLGPAQSQTLDDQANLWVQQRNLTPALVQVGGNRRFFSDPPQADASDGLRASGLALPDPAS